MAIIISSYNLKKLSNGSALVSTLCVESTQDHFP